MKKSITLPKASTDNPTPRHERWGSTSEAAKFGVSRSTLYRLKNEGKIITGKLGHRTMWDLDSIGDLIESSIEIQG